MVPRCALRGIISGHARDRSDGAPAPNHRHTGLAWVQGNVLGLHEANLRPCVGSREYCRAPPREHVQLDAARVSGRTANALWRLKRGDELVDHAPIISGDDAELWPVGARAHTRPRGCQELAAARAGYGEVTDLAHLPRDSGDVRLSSCAAVPSHWSRTAWR